MLRRPSSEPTERLVLMDNTHCTAMARFTVWSVSIRCRQDSRWRGMVHRWRQRGQRLRGYRSFNQQVGACVAYGSPTVHPKLRDTMCLDLRPRVTSPNCYFQFIVVLASGHFTKKLKDWVSWVIAALLRFLALHNDDDDNNNLTILCLQT